MSATAVGVYVRWPTDSSMWMSAAATAAAGIPSTMPATTSSGTMRRRMSPANAAATSPRPNTITAMAITVPWPVAVTQALTTARPAARKSPTATRTQTSTTLPSRDQTLSGTGWPVPSSSGRATASTR